MRQIPLHQIKPMWKVREENNEKVLYLDCRPTGDGLGSRLRGIVSAWRWSFKNSL